jgi:hypothetical protein
MNMVKILDNIFVGAMVIVFICGTLLIIILPNKPCPTCPKNNEIKNVSFYFNETIQLKSHEDKWIALTTKDGSSRVVVAYLLSAEGQVFAKSDPVDLNDYVDPKFEDRWYK